MRWIARCRQCGTVLNTDSRAFHDPDTHTVICLACAYADPPPEPEPSPGPFAA